MPRKRPRQFLLCVSNAGYPASLEVRKVYAAVPDSKAEADGFVRVVDESGQDYLYPQSFFIAIELPADAAELVMSTAAGGSTS